MLRSLPAAGALFTIATIATAQSAPPVITPHVVTGGPAGRFVVDIEVTVDPNDAWTAGGVSASAGNGVSFVYATEPNDGGPIPTAPDLGTGGRFVSFVSLPRGQTRNSRFRAGGAVSIAGAFHPAGRVGNLLPGLFNIAYLEFPPTATQGSGFTTRLAWDVGGDVSRIVITTVDPGRDNTLSRVLIAHATRNFASPLTQIEFWVAIPEPASLALLMLGGLFLIRGRCVGRAR